MAERFDLIIVGMGSGGMTAAEFAATLDLKVVIIERARVGGDCLWTGCVPSKALLASAKVAHTMRHAARYGLESHEPTIDTAKVWRRIRAVQAEIAQSEDNPERFEAMGITLIRGHAMLTGPNEVTVDNDLILEGRFIMLCTGSRPVEPELPGLQEAGFLTNETMFELDQPPRSIVVIGGGPVAVEMSQGMNRLGIRTTVLQLGTSILPADEPTLAALLARTLRAEGVDLRLHAEAIRVGSDAHSKTVTALVNGHEEHFSAEEILVAVGRRPNVDGLGLDALGIEVGLRGVPVDNRGRTTVKTVYAVGDVAGRWLFTHSAGYEGVRAVRDMFFPGKGHVENLIPWCTFTDPELAHAGMTIAQAELAHGDDVDVWRQDLIHNDRARTDDATSGAVILVSSKQRIVGAHILAPAAGEMIHELALAIQQNLKIGDLASLVHVYPTFSTATGQLAAESAFEKAQKLRWLVKR